MVHSYLPNSTVLNAAIRDGNEQNQISKVIEVKSAIEQDQPQQIDVPMISSFEIGSNDHKLILSLK